MSKKTNGVNYGRTVAQRSRRSRVISMLEAQLKRGTKPSKENNKKLVSLTDKDISRINKEISTLKQRI